MVYLNNAATSYPKPAAVIKAVADYISGPPHQPSRSGFNDRETDPVQSCRQLLVQLFNAPDPQRLIFTSGATEALNLVIRGISDSGGHIITSSIEHNSVLRPLKTLERDRQLTLSIVPCDNTGTIDPDAIAAQITPATTAVLINHISNVTGAVTDLSAIGKIATEHNIPLIVDASQSAGAWPIDIQSQHIAILVFTGHKSLFGLPGIGGLYLGEAVKLKPLKTGGTGVRSDYPYQPETLPLYFEAGTQNLPGIISLQAGVRYLLDEGLEKIRRQKLAVVRYLLDYLEQNDQIILYRSVSLADPPLVFSFNIKGLDSAEVGYILEHSFQIVTRSGLHCAPLIHQAIGSFPAGSVRVSPSHFTSIDAADQFIAAIQAICDTTKKT